jgi:hypothetical protein
MAARATIRPEVIKKLEPLRPRLLTMKCAAAYLGISVWTLREMIYRDELKPVRLTETAHPRLDLRDLDRLIETHKGH